MADTASTVASVSSAVRLMLPDWQLAAALLGGTRAMREAGTIYLPKWPKETEDAYQARLSVSVLFPAYRRAVQVLASKPFSRPLTLSEDMSSKVRSWCDNIDLQHRNLHAFSSEAMELTLSYGLGGILVDYPRRPQELPNTAAAEANAALRPYWVLIKPHQILGWRAARGEDNIWRLTQLRLLEEVEEPDGIWGTVVLQQVRVLMPGSFEIHRKDAKGEWALYEGPTKTTLDEIPFVPLYGEQLGFMAARPPLIEIAHMNVAHWQSASDQQNILHVARVPILAVSGVDDAKWELGVGTSSAVKLPNENSKLMYVEHTGSAIGAGQKDLDAIEERMRQAGAELLVIQPGRLTATQIIAENSIGICVLQQIAQNLQDALNRALEITAEWVNDPKPGTVTLFTDFAAASLAEASAQLVLQTNQAGKISDETLFAELQRRGVITTAHTWADEKTRLQTQLPSIDPVTGKPTEPTTPPAPSAPTSVAPPGPAVDLSPLADALQALATAQAAAPTINIAPPAVTVNVPEQPAPNITVQAPVVNVAPPAITVDAPVVNISPPDVTVTPAPITVNTPPVNVIVERGTGKAKLVEDTSGKITGIELQ